MARLCRIWRAGAGRVGLAILAVAALAVPTALAAATAAPTQSGDPYDLAHDPSAQQAIRESRAAADRRREYRASPRGKEARQRSRTAYRHSSRADALALAREQFADAIGSRVTHGLALPPGQHLVKYAGERGAVVQRDGSDQRAIVESTFPLRTKTDSGDLEPTDLRLEEHADGFDTANAPVPVHVGKDAAAGVELPGGIALRPVGTAPGASGDLASDRAFFANVAADTDMWVTPRSGGAEIFMQLRSPDAPDVHEYRVDMPAGAVLRSSDTNPGAVEVYDGSKVIAAIEPPAAYDADGVRVPMSYRVEGDRLYVTVAHRDGDYRYPILADPTIDRFWSLGYPDQGGWAPQINGGGAWGFDLNSGDAFGRPYWGRGLWIWDAPGAQYTVYWSGEWLYRWSHGSSYITQLQAGGADFEPRVTWGVLFDCQSFGIWNESGQAWDGGLQNYCESHMGWDVTDSAGPNFDYGTPGNHATNLVWSTRTGLGQTQTVSEVDWMRVWLSDRDSPSTPTLSPSPPSPAPWEDTGSRSVTVGSSDGGLGMKRLELRVPSSASPQTSTDSCGGSPDSGLCPTSMSSVFTYSLGGLPEGAISGSAQGFDILDHASAAKTWPLRIDHSAPRIDAPTGTLGTNGAWVGPGAQDLHVASHDDYSGVQQSQISIAPSLQGLDRFTRTASADWGAGALGGQWTLRSGSASNLSVNGSEGQIASPANVDHTVALGSLSLLNAESAVDVRFPATVASAGDVRPTLFLRRGASGQYGAVMIRDAAGKIWLRLTTATSQIGTDTDTGLVYAPGDLIRLKLSVNGTNPTTIKAKAWRVGSPEPSAWTVTRTDSTGPQVAGEPAIRLVHTTAGTPTVGFDNYSVSTLSPLVRDTKQNKKADGTAAPCDATSGCLNDLTHDFTWDTSDEMDGPHTFTVHANDPLAHAPADKTWTVNVDHTSPYASAGPSGSLWDNRGGYIDSGSYDLHATVTDPTSGSGVRDIQVLVNGTEEDSAHAQQTCNPNCPASAPRDFTFDTANRAEGRYHVQMIAHDKVSNPATIADFYITYDKSPPDIQMSGTAWNARNTQLGAGTYTLHVQATDGSPTPESARRSGVHGIEILVDGEREDYVTQPCTQGNCSMSRDWTLDTSAYDSGHHTVDVVADDQMGHEGSQGFDFDIACCSAAASTWGSWGPTYDVYHGDVNGDDLTDSVARDRVTGSVSVALSNGTSFAAATSWGTWDLTYDLHVADVNADGLDDLVGVNVAGDVRVGLSTGAAFQAGVTWGSVPAGDELYVADVDGDDAADAIGYQRSSGALVEAEAQSIAQRFDPAVPYGNVAATLGSLQFADMDGDGADDVVVNRSNGDLLVGISSGDTFDPPALWATWSPDSYLVALGDVDGDGPADAVVVDKRPSSCQTTTAGLVCPLSVSASNGSGFDAPTQYGSWNTIYSKLDAVDLDGDGRADFAGASPLNGVIAAALSNSPAPEGAAVEDFVPDPNVSYEPDVEDPDPAQSSTVTAAAAAPTMKLAFQDDKRLLARNFPSIPYRLGAFDPQGQEPEALARIDRIYQRMAEMGASIVRFNADWGLMENHKVDTNNDGVRDTYPSGKAYNFDLLDAAVRLARQHGFGVELTMMAFPKKQEGCGIPGNPALYPDARSCADDPDPTLDTDPVDYGKFVKATVLHYTRQGTDASSAPRGSTDDLRVKDFSIWNEPNGKAFLRYSAHENRIPAGLYRSMYKEAYRQYTSVIAGAGASPTPVTGTRIFIGELASRKRTNRVDNATSGKCATKCPVTPQQFLQKVANKPDDPLLTNGVAYHPYDDESNPRMRLPRHEPKYGAKYTGITRLKGVTDAIHDLCDAGADKKCRGGLRTPSSNAPRMFLTEFGYKIKPLRSGIPNNTWHKETTRASWLLGYRPRTGPRRGALDNALNGGARWMLYYHSTEEPERATQFSWDAGLIGLEPDESPNDGRVEQNDDIVGKRSYGKTSKKDSGGAYSTNASIQRGAYCAIRQWAIYHHYVNLITGAKVTWCPYPGT